MALQAIDTHMGSGEFKRGQAVVEGDLVPALSRVASSAVLAELAIVRVVSAVAGEAVLRRSLVDILRVAVAAVHLFVPSGQPKSSPVMVEGGSIPTVRCVAASAVLAELAIVRIVSPVAGEAVLRRSLIDILRVAVAAVHVMMAADQVEFSPVMVEGGSVPTVRCVASSAVLAELAIVRIVSPVAARAISGRRLQVGPGARLNVAVGTFNQRMLSLQRQSRLIMIESLSIGISAIMAAKTSQPKGFLVDLHVGPIQRTVAVSADKWIKASEVCTVAVAAGKRASIGELPVALQRVAGSIVRKRLGIDNRQECLSPKVLAVALAARDSLASIQQRSVQTLWILQFVPNGSMTDQAAVSHSLGAPEGSVTCRAAAARVAVGADAAQEYSTDTCVQRARAEQSPAEDQHGSQDHGQGGERGNDSASG